MVRNLNKKITNNKPSPSFTEEEIKMLETESPVIFKKPKIDETVDCLKLKNEISKIMQNENDNDIINQIITIADKIFDYKKINISISVNVEK